MNYLIYQASLIRIEELHREAAAQRLAKAVAGGNSDRRARHLARLLNTLARNLRVSALNRPHRGPEGAATVVPQSPHH